MFTKAQDVVVALKLCLDGNRQSYAELARGLGMSASEVHAAVRRLDNARLVEPETRQVRRETFGSFLIHGVPFDFPASPKNVTRGMPTAWAAPVMQNKFSGDGQLPPVWADLDGTVQGASVSPLYPSVPQAARTDPQLYDLLALVDAIRIGRARERHWAEKEIINRLAQHAKTTA